MLSKFLFPEEKLSVQVHPDDATAQRFGEPWGKTECWYVAHARPGSQIALGLKPGVTAEQFGQAIHENRAEDLLNWIDVYQGEMIYVAAGTVHTLGPGAVIVETQQQSDTTYRLYDYGRPRPLHLERGLAVGEREGRIWQSDTARARQYRWRQEPSVDDDCRALLHSRPVRTEGTARVFYPRCIGIRPRCKFWLRWKAAESWKPRASAP